MGNIPEVYRGTQSQPLTLPNQKRLRIRPLERYEEAPLRELFARLSPRSRELRFLSPLPRVPESLIRQIACVDDHRSVALVAEDPQGLVVGLANFGAVDDRTAELALVVQDDWQRQRLGTELAKLMLLAAQTRGFTRFVVTMHSDNVAIRRLLKHLGKVTSWAMSGAITELTFVPCGISS